jgi:hypothetical protein
MSEKGLGHNKITSYRKRTALGLRAQLLSLNCPQNKFLRAISFYEPSLASAKAAAEGSRH